MSNTVTKPSKVKELALTIASQNRPKFKRCGKSFLDRIEARARAMIVDEVNRHPSIGMTLK